jgi:ferredoxin
MKVVVDRSKCSSIGMCEAIAPDLFEIGPDGALHILQDDVSESRRADIEQACEDCPTQALSIQ